MKILNCLSIEEINFLSSNKIGVNELFDGRFLIKEQIISEMNDLNARFYLSNLECKSGHRIRKKSGHCIQCDTSGIGFRNRENRPAEVYIAISILSEKVKIGWANFSYDREISLNKRRFDGAKDWKVICFFNVDNAAAVEREIQSSIRKYENSLHLNYDIKFSSKETFSLVTIFFALGEIKKHGGASIQGVIVDVNGDICLERLYEQIYS